MLQNEKYTLIILAGGKSSRMGFNKALAEIKGKSFLDHLIDELSPLADDIMISGPKNIYGEMPYKIVEDLHKDCGPIGGIQAGIQLSGNDLNIIISCDTPLVSSELIRYLSGQDFDDCVVPVEAGQVHPLCGIYRKKSLRFINAAIEKKSYGMTSLLHLMNSTYVTIDDSLPFYNKRLLMNINTPEDLKIIADET